MGTGSSHHTPARKSLHDVFGFELHNLTLDSLLHAPAPRTACAAARQTFAAQRRFLRAVDPLLRSPSDLKVRVFPKDVLGRGKSAVTVRATHRGVGGVVKLPQSKGLNGPMLHEAVVHAMLCAEKETWQGQWQGAEFPFPCVEAVGSRDGMVFIFMERLDLTLLEYVLSPRFSPDSFAEIVLQVTIALDALQKQLGFVHRDLHASNIMLRKRKSPAVMTYRLKTKTVKVRSTHRAFIVDLGMCCTRENPRTSLDTPYGSITCDAVGCRNHSFDLRYLLGSLKTSLFGARGRGGGGLGDELATLVTAATDGISLEKIPPRDRTRLKGHLKIVTVINDPADERYLPAAVYAAAATSLLQQQKKKQKKINKCNTFF
jgi:tRNA A-37 threonylcarbamoyl transferase component Bud32